MPFLQNKSSLAITHEISADSVEYQQLIALRDPTNAAKTLYEAIAEEDVVDTNGRIILLRGPGAAAGSDETTAQKENPGRGGSITDVRYLASAAITGADTNSRTLTVQQVTVSGTSTPTRAVTTLATLALTNGINAPANAVSPAFTINNAAFVGDEPLELKSAHVGTGLADPGGFVVITYTPA